MPSLTVDTTSPAGSWNSQAPSPSSHPASHSSSPTRPPYSPITPVLGPSRPATDAAPASSNPSTHTSPSQPLQRQPQRAYTHLQPEQSFIPRPAPPTETIHLDDNPDAIALRSAISILQMQKQTAIKDMKTLKEVKQRALDDPETFVEALLNGDIKTRHGAAISLPTNLLGDDDEENENQADAQSGNGSTNNVEANLRKRKWPELPTHQNIMKTPPINWAEYGIVGESLDKIHADQVLNPSEGKPETLDTHGHILERRSAGSRPLPTADLSQAAGVRPPMEKMGTRKNGKR